MIFYTYLPVEGQRLAQSRSFSLSGAWSLDDKELARRRRLVTGSVG
jgi:hypothetical protein